LSGFEVCQRIKDDPATENISILIVTALAEMGDVEKGIDCGADDFLTKPVNKFELLTRVKSLLRVRLLKSNLERTLQYIKEIEKEELKG
jgi:two-component system alkaline phosphatase synthesis response regulator PhoP